MRRSIPEIALPQSSWYHPVLPEMAPGALVELLMFPENSIVCARPAMLVERVAERYGKFAVFWRDIEQTTEVLNHE